MALPLCERAISLNDDTVLLAIFDNVFLLKQQVKSQGISASRSCSLDTRDAAANRKNQYLNDYCLRDTYIPRSDSPQSAPLHIPRAPPNASRR